MNDVNKRTYSKKEALEVLRLAASLQGKPDNFFFPDQQVFTLDELIATSAEAGIDPGHIEKASAKYIEIQAAHLSSLTNTHAFEERRIVTRLDKNSLWHEVISELKFRMGENTTVTSKKGLTNEWGFTNRSGIETSVGMVELEDGAILKFSQRIGIASPWIESLLAGETLSLVIFGYIYLIMEPSIYKSLIFLIALAGVLSLTLNKINVRRRAQKLKKFQHLVDLVSEAIPYEYEKETPGISNDEEQSPETNTTNPNDDNHSDF